MSERNRQINIRVTEAEYKMIKRGAEENTEGNLAMFIRRAALERVRAVEGLAQNTATARQWLASHGLDGGVSE